MATTINISMLYKKRNTGCRAGHKHTKEKEASPFGDFLFIAVTP